MIPKYLVRMDLIYEGITTPASPLNLQAIKKSQNGPDLRRDYDRLEVICLPLVACSQNGPDLRRDYDHRSMADAKELCQMSEWT